MTLPASLPPVGLSRDLQARLSEQTGRLAEALGVVGLMNVQYAIKDGAIFVLEVNPRASRTVPFVSQGHRGAARKDRRTVHGRKKAPGVRARS